MVWTNIWWVCDFVHNFQVYVFCIFQNWRMPSSGFLKNKSGSKNCWIWFFFQKPQKDWWVFMKELVKNWWFCEQLCDYFKKNRTIVGLFWEFRSNPQLPRLDPLLVLDPVSRTLNVSILRSGFCFKNKKKKTCSMSDNCFPVAPVSETYAWMISLMRFQYFAGSFTLSLASNSELMLY